MNSATSKCRTTTARLVNEATDRRLQELELRCDGVAVITMNRIGLDSEHLVSAATKLGSSRAPWPKNEARYVPLDQQIWFIRTLTRLTAVRR